MIDEEACSHCRVIVSVTQSGHVTCTKKIGAGSLLPESLVDLIAVSVITIGVGCPHAAGVFPPFLLTLLTNFISWLQVDFSDKSCGMYYTITILDCPRCRNGSKPSTIIKACRGIKD